MKLLRISYFVTQRVHIQKYHVILIGLVLPVPQSVLLRFHPQAPHRALRRLHLHLRVHPQAQAHVFHLKTRSFAALEDFYKGIVDLADSYVETYQGNRRQLIGPIKSYKILNDPKKSLMFLVSLRKSIRRLKLPRSGPLRNIQDSVMELIDSTIYKLQFLK